MQTEVGAGRIIGDAGNFINVFCFLTGATPTVISVDAIHSSKGNLFPTDNFSVQFHFNDGSLCTLLYTSIGHQRMSKERLEIFFDGKSIVMQDFLKLSGYGLPASFSTIENNANAGHEALVRNFFEQVRQQQFNPPIPTDQLLLTAELTLIVDKLACEGGGSTFFA
jgi:predicted dehydrogenase